MRSIFGALFKEYYNSANQCLLFRAFFRHLTSTVVTHRLGRNFRNFGHLLLCSIYGAKNDFQENMT